MGRTRTFVEADVLAIAAELFRTRGYEGTGIDELLTATGLHRGSLYKAFGSKRALFVATLRAALAVPSASVRARNAALDLMLVALLELAPRDHEVRRLVADQLAEVPDAERVLGTRLLDRAGVRRR